MGLTDRVARHIVMSPSGAVPAEALEAARWSLLDAIGVSMAATGMEPACAAFARIAELGGPGPCVPLGGQVRTSLPSAALANGALAHAIDFEDALDASPIHPNACAVAAALAVAQHCGDVSGRELLAAIAVGCDLVCRLALALRGNPDGEGWYTPPILGAYGATVVASRLLRLDVEQTVHALSLTLAQVTCPNQFKDSTTSSLRAVRDAFATQGAVMACLLAGEGVRGFEQTFEGRAGLFNLYAKGQYEPYVILEGLGTDFLGSQVSYKLWPACRGTHAFIEAALAFRSETGLGPGDIETIEASGTGFLSFLALPSDRKSAPGTAIDAKFSIPFTVATALMAGQVGLDSFTRSRLACPTTRALASKVRFVPEGSGFNNANAGRLTIGTKDGGLWDRSIAPAFGHPDNPLPPGALEAKFRDCAARAARPPAPESIDRFLGVMANLASDATTAGSSLLNHLHPHHAGVNAHAVN